MKKKIAIIGASYLQLPLILRAKEMGLETHVFAWATGDIGEKEADFFYPISIRENESILKKCREIGIEGISSIGSDLAMYTVNYVASEMNLVGNSLDCTEKTTNKGRMRQTFYEHGDPSPWSKVIVSTEDIIKTEIPFPVIVKPTDRSGSRGVTKVTGETELEFAIKSALEQSFKKEAIIEEYISGNEYSVEFISWAGEHRYLAITQKYTTGAPHFVERAHLEPADIDGKQLKKIKKTVSHALSSLGVEYGASHSEIKIRDDEIRIIEIGARMGGDHIGSKLVKLSTGMDYVGAVIDIAFGIKPSCSKLERRASAIRYIFDDIDIQALKKLKKDNPGFLVCEERFASQEGLIQDSSLRKGYFTMCAQTSGELMPYLPPSDVYSD